MVETKAPASIRRYVSSIAAMYRAAGALNPAASQRVKLALKRLHREQGRAQRQAAPLGRPLVDRMLAVPVAGPKGLRNRAVLAVAYDTLARRSELAALQVNDLVLEDDRSGTVLIQRSKTNQEGLGMVRFLASDTVWHLKAWLNAAGLSEGPLFRTVPKGARIGGGMCDGDVARIFKAMALAAGLPVEAVASISGHSSRVGAAQDQMAAGISLSAIMQADGWQTSEMVARYTRRLDARRSGSAQLAAMRLRGGG
jgi:integrase